ncbi:MAG: U32 family peptidase, partial [Clostridia bacterium]|nr:U32 family peptidase [Clostridia bacterium]
MAKLQSQSSRPLPELLCPAGSPLALDAAIEGGADAVYLGGIGFNARRGATNFDEDALREGIRRAHAYGVKVYLTLNTLVYDREMNDYLRAAALAQSADVDALIVADLGGAAVIHRHLPELALHASTQASVHSAAAGKMLLDMGFSRMVVARELPLCDLRTIVDESPIEIEAFIHGALCVCHSGQCLYSSLVGGRSGNRGECAQPCRLPCRTDKGKSDYPLSLKDLSLARHVPDLIDAGISSLKIEGRMRSPEYVLTVARIWRRLLDERRGANEDEMQILAEAFSRGGFTDGYFTSKINRSMLGIRSEEDKQAGRALSPFQGLKRRVPAQMQATVKRGCPISLTLTTPTATFTATGEIPQDAINAPLDEETVRRQLTKLGNTPFEASAFDLSLDKGLMLPISSLNALRRAAVDGLTAQPSTETTALPALRSCQPQNDRGGNRVRTAHMTSAAQLTSDAADYFDICYLPPHELLALSDELWQARSAKTELAVALPPIVMDHERNACREELRALSERGIRRALLGNLWHLPLVTEAGLIPDGDLRLNVTNTETVARL